MQILYLQNEMSPFIWAVKCKNLELIELFAEKGADLSKEDANGDNALIHAVKSTAWNEESVIEFHRNYKEYFKINHKNKVLLLT